MKKIVNGSLLLMMFALLTLNTPVHALEPTYLTNNNGIDITEQEYRNLLNLGFNENEIQNMHMEEFLENKDLIGHVVAQETTVVGEEDLQDVVKPFGYNPGYVANSAQILQTTITAINGRYRYKTTLQWTRFPGARSYDIIGIGMEPNVTLYANTHFQQNYCKSATDCGTGGIYGQKISSTGCSATYQLASGSFISMDVYFYYDVTKNTSDTITELRATGDYAHAMTTVSYTNGYSNHTITRGGLIIGSAIENYYDEIPYARAIYNGLSW